MLAFVKVPALNVLHLAIEPNRDGNFDQRQQEINGHAVHSANALSSNSTASEMAAGMTATGTKKIARNCSSTTLSFIDTGFMLPSLIASGAMIDVKLVTIQKMKNATIDCKTVATM